MIQMKQQVEPAQPRNSRIDSQQRPRTPKMIKS